MRHIAAIGALCFAVWLLYAPATNRVFAADQIWYFAELDGQTSLAAGLHHYDYAVSRRYWKGDDALFRPLLFVWLAAANSMFGVRHVAWNVATLAIHMAIVAALYWLLTTIQPSPFAFGFAALFAVMTSAVDLVLWNHLGGYLLAWLSLLIGLRAFVVLIRAEVQLPRSQVLTFAVAFGAAGVLHESMVPVSLLSAALIVVRVRRVQRRLPAATIASLFAPALLYAALYVLHLQRVARIGYVDSGGSADLFGVWRLFAAIPRTWRTVFDWTMEIAMPSALQVGGEAYARLAVRFDPSIASPLHWFNALLAVAAVTLVALAGSRERRRRHAALLTVLAAVLIVYAGIISLGRTREEILAVGYYLYLFSLIVVVITYAATDFAVLLGARAQAAWLTIILLASLHTIETRRVVSRVKEANEPASAYLHYVQQFVDAHRHEPGFSFATQRPTALDPEIELVEGYPDDPAVRVRKMRVTEVLFKRYYNANRPKYVPF